MAARKEITKEMRKKYMRAKKGERAAMLDMLCYMTGYNRSYLARILRSAPAKQAKKIPMKRPRIYDDALIKKLIKVWAVLDGPCGKRFAPVIKETVLRLEKFDEISLSDEQKCLLFKMSPATIDRRLARVRKDCELKGRSQTKPGTLLKHQIKVRTFSEWDEGVPGFVEIDLVGHDGGNLRGEFMQTLDVTDVLTGWTELRAVRNKAQVWVFDALVSIAKDFPFKILGIDSDNGSEFINNHLVRYCKEQEITFTRSRPYRKNDNCFVEQKNFSVARKYAGYLRHDTKIELDILNKIYEKLSLYVNFFQPSMKLVEKTRSGSKVKRVHDKAMTPYKRLIASGYLTIQETKKTEGCI